MANILWRLPTMASLSGGWIALFFRTDRIRGITAAQVLFSAEIFEI
jgi:hypothetical protein